MKIWKIDSVVALNTNALATALNRLEKERKQIKEILYNNKYNEYEIIYTVDDNIMNEIDDWEDCK